MAFTGAGAVYSFDGGTFVVSALCLALIRLTPTEKSAKPSTIRLDLHRGWREFRSRTWMWSVIVVWVFFGLLVFGPYIPLGSRLISDRLGAAAYGWVMATLGAGTIVGGLIAIRRRPSRPLAAGGMAIIGFTCIPLSVALELPLPLLMIGHMIGGCALAFWSVMWSTSVQTQVAADVLNRVTAYEVAGSVSGVAIGQALVGPVAQVINPRTLLFVSATVCVLVCVTLLLTKPVRSLRRSDAQPVGELDQA
jgi:predicted MFS family arabinose efflux permease